MKFCSNCGQQVSLKTPTGDNRQRHVCDHCDTIHYVNPRIVVGCLPIYGEQILLCQRAIEPRRGYWTLPAGFLEVGETSEEGAIRESREEANADLEVQRLYAIFNIPEIAQVYMFYQAKPIDTRFAAGEESLAVQLFDEQDIPWDELAFPVINYTLKHFFKHRQQTGEHPLLNRDVMRRDRIAPV